MTRFCTCVCNYYWLRGGYAAFGAHGLEAGALGRIAVVGAAPCLAAFAAALRIVLKPFIREKLLFVRSENELFRAVFTGKRFVFHDHSLPVLHGGIRRK